MQQLLATLFEFLEASAIASSIRQSTWLYPIIEIIHILGIVLVAGGAVMFDLLFLTRRHEFPQPPGLRLLGWSKRGLWLVIPSGVLLFLTNAVALSADPVFWTKLSLLLLAGFNAWIFHVRVRLPHESSNGTTFKHHTATTNAAASIILWTTIIACGRLLAY